jgi:hypothetical protein
MSIDLYWDNDDQTVMLAEFNGRWTWDELYAALNTIKKMSQERERVFGAIIDVRDGLHIPGGSIFNRDALNNFRKLMKLGDDGKGPVVIVGVNKMVRTVFDAAGKIDSKSVQDVHFSKDMDDARRTIYEIMAGLQRQTTSA